MKVFTILLITSVFTCHCSGKVFTKCGLLVELTRRHFGLERQWVCVIESESQRNTTKVTQKADGSTSYGLFQINNKEWCSKGKPGGKCRVKCEDLINEDISDDVSCAKMVHRERGFKAWDGWKRACAGRTAVYQYKC